MRYAVRSHGSRKGRETWVLTSSLLWIWRVADGHTRNLAIAALLLVLISSGVAATTPVVLQQLVDALANGWMHEGYKSASFLMASYVLLHWISRVSSEIQEAVLARADQRLNRQLSCRFLDHVMAMPFRYHLNSKTGALSQTLTNGLLGYRIALRHFINSVLPMLLQAAAIVTMLVLLDQTVFVMVISCTILLYLLVFWLGGIRVGTVAKDASAAHIHTGAVFTDSVLNVEAVKCFGGESLISRRFQRSLDYLERQYGKVHARRLENGIAAAFLFGGSLTLSVFLAVRETRAGQMSVGEFVMINAYILQLTRPLELLGIAIREMVQGLAFVRGMGSLLEVRQELDHPHCHRRLPHARPDLVVENLSLSYRTGHKVLSDLNFAIRAGTTVAIVGPSGSGKTSLVRLFTRLLEPTAGRILIGNTSLSDISLVAIRRAFAIVPQDTMLFDAPISFNIAFGMPHCSQQQIVNAAKAAGLHDFIAGLPDGYSTEVGERGLKLSGGERQRIALARAALRKPHFYVFDEATSSLDASTERAVLDALLEVTARRTTIIITHRLPIVVHADEIVVLHNGRMVERGTHSTLMSECGVYSTMWHLQHWSVGGADRRGGQFVM